MPRCPGCYRILSHHRLDTHLRWCRACGDRERWSGDGLERLDAELTGVERRIARRIDAVEAELDYRDSVPTDTDTSRSDPVHPTN